MWKNSRSGSLQTCWEAATRLRRRILKALRTPREARSRKAAITTTTKVGCKRRRVKSDVTFRPAATRRKIAQTAQNLIDQSRFIQTQNTPRCRLAGAKTYGLMR